MTVYNKIAELSKSFPYRTFTVYTLDGNTGRIIDFGLDEREARSYLETGRKNGISVYIAEYNPETATVCFDFH